MREQPMIRRFTIAGEGEGVEFSDGVVAVRWPDTNGFEMFDDFETLTDARPKDTITWIDEEI